MTHYCLFLLSYPIILIVIPAHKQLLLCTVLFWKTVTRKLFKLCHSSVFKYWLSHIWMLLLECIWHDAYNEIKTFPLDPGLFEVTRFDLLLHGVYPKCALWNLKFMCVATDIEVVKTYPIYAHLGKYPLIFNHGYANWKILCFWCD